MKYKVMAEAWTDEGGLLEGYEIEDGDLEPDLIANLIYKGVLEPETKPKKNIKKEKRGT